MFLPSRSVMILSCMYVILILIILCLHKPLINIKAIIPSKYCYDIFPYSNQWIILKVDSNIHFSPSLLKNAHEFNHRKVNAHCCKLPLFCSKITFPSFLTSLAFLFNYRSYCLSVMIFIPWFFFRMSTTYHLIPCTINTTLQCMVLLSIHHVSCN